MILRHYKIHDDLERRVSRLEERQLAMLANYELMLEKVNEILRILKEGHRA